MAVRFAIQLTLRDQSKNSIPYFPAMALKSGAGPGLDGLPVSVIVVTTSSMNASKIPPGELIDQLAAGFRSDAFHAVRSALRRKHYVIRSKLEHLAISLHSKHPAQIM